MLEHHRDVRLRRTDNSAVAEHAWDSDHPPNWDEVRCIAQDVHWYTRRVKEAIQIRLHPNNINRDNGIDIPEEWLPTIRRHEPPSVAKGDSARSAPAPSTPVYSGTYNAPSPTSAILPPEAPAGSDGGNASDWPAAPANSSAASAFPPCAILPPEALANSDGGNAGDWPAAPANSSAASALPPRAANTRKRYITRLQQRSVSLLDKD